MICYYQSLPGRNMTQPKKSYVNDSHNTRLVVLETTIVTLVLKALH